MSDLGLGLVPSDPPFLLEAHLPEVWAGACLLLRSPLLPSAAHSTWQFTLPSQLAVGSDAWVVAVVFWPLFPLVQHATHSQQIITSHENQHNCSD